MVGRSEDGRKGQSWIKFFFRNVSEVVFMYKYDMMEQDALLFSVEELRAWAEQHPEVVARFEKARGKHARRKCLFCASIGMDDEALSRRGWPGRCVRATAQHECAPKPSIHH